MCICITISTEPCHKNDPVSLRLLWMQSEIEYHTTTSGNLSVVLRLVHTGGLVYTET